VWQWQSKVYNYVCITTNQPDTKSTPNTNPNPNPTNEQRAIVNIQLNVVTCPTYPEKFIRDNVVAPFVPTSIVTVTLSTWQEDFACNTYSGKEEKIDIIIFFALGSKDPEG